MPKRHFNDCWLVQRTHTQAIDWCLCVPPLCRSSVVREYAMLRLHLLSRQSRRVEDDFSLLGRRMEIRLVTRRLATELDIERIAVFCKQQYAQVWSGSQPQDLVPIMRRVREMAKQSNRVFHIIVAEGEPGIVALAELSWHGDRRASLSVGVERRFRQLGLATRLLQLVTAQLVERGIQSVNVVTNSCHPVGHLLLSRMHGTALRSACVLEAKRQDLDEGVLRYWMGRYNPNQSISVRMFRGRYPDDELRSLVSLKAMVREVYGTLPPGKEGASLLAVLRREEERLENSETERLALVLTTADGDRVGYCEARWNHHPVLVEESESAVARHVQGLGLGKYLKARLLAEVLALGATVQSIRTTNLASAAGMIRTNEQVGFRVHHTYTSWEIMTQRLIDYMSRAAAVRSC
jgi:GNAT superfamily N-acetyltransferase